MGKPVSPEEYGEGMDDVELKAAGWAVGLDVWGPVDKAYGNFVQDDTLANSQLWSLDQAIRADVLAGAEQGRTWYRALCPDGTLWCESGNPAEVALSIEGEGEGYTLQQLKTYIVRTPWEHWEPPNQA